MNLNKSINLRKQIKEAQSQLDGKGRRENRMLYCQTVKKIQTFKLVGHGKRVSYFH